MPDPDIEVLKDVARVAAKKWPGLAPLGGRRWTKEDIDRGVSIAFEVSKEGAFKKRFPEGLQSPMARAYLIVALRNRLLKARRRADWMSLFSDLATDVVPATRYCDPRLEVIDPEIFADRILTRMGREASEELRRRLQCAGSSGACVAASGDPVTRTQKRRWAAVSCTMVTAAKDYNLTWEELRRIFAIIAVKVTG